MGCSGSVIVADFRHLPEESADFRDLCVEYNEFCVQGKRIAEEFDAISRKIEISIYEFFPESKNAADFGRCIIEGYLKYILSLIHYLYKTKQVPQPLTFSNYLPGIIIDQSLFESTTDGCEAPLLRKYEILRDITLNLPKFIDDFDRLSEKMIHLAVGFRDKYPARFYQRSLDLPGISCVIPFSQIELVLIHNIEVIAHPAIQFEQVFKNIRVYVKNIQEIIEKCHQRFSDFKKILDGVDLWDYSVKNEEIDRRLSKFFTDLNFVPQSTSYT